MPALAIDTSTEVLSVALAVPGELPDEVDIDAGRTHLEMLLPAIDGLLEGRGFEPRSLDLIVTGTGPGTFSGLRVGIATARALAQALKVPLLGASSLAALAAAAADSAWARRGPEAGGGEAGESTGGPGGRAGANAGSDAAAGTPAIMPVIDARRGQVFAQIYRKNGDKVMPASDIFCQSPAELIARVAQDAPGTVTVGNGVLAYYELFSHGGFRLPEAGSRLHRVRAACHIPSGAARLEFDSAAVLAVRPVYVREPDADKTVLLRKREPWL